MTNLSSMVFLEMYDKSYVQSDKVSEKIYPVK